MTNEAEAMREAAARLCEDESMHHGEKANDQTRWPSSKDHHRLCAAVCRNRANEIRALPLPEPTAEKRAPVQGLSAGIPWSMHLRAYDAYCKAYGKQDALIDLEGRNCRGGFGVTELDRFIPGWRDEMSLIAERDATIARLSAELEAARAEIFQTRKFWSDHADKDCSALREARAALEGVIAVADRKTVEFDAARAVLAKLSKGA